MFFRPQRRSALRFRPPGANGGAEPADRPSHHGQSFLQEVYTMANFTDLLGTLIQ